MAAQETEVPDRRPHMKKEKAPNMTPQETEVPDSEHQTSIYQMRKSLKYGTQRN